MTERQLTFIDVDENRFELWLKRDRIQLAVIDSRPELEAGELRRFASVIFTEYVGRALMARLGAARAALEAARIRHAGDAIDDALRAIDAVVAAAAIPDVLADEPAPEALPGDPAPDLAELESGEQPAAPPPRVLTGRQPYPLLRAIRRGKPAGEGSVIRWIGRSGTLVP